jgi:alpha-glucosidase
MDDPSFARIGNRVVSGRARFTVLFPRLIRLEFADDARFEDRPTLAFINRDTPPVEFSVAERDGELLLETEALRLRWKLGAAFTARSLEIRSRSGSPEFSWKPGRKDKGNLGGTRRTLDSIDGAAELEPGILSKDGWTVVDDSRRPLFTKDFSGFLPREAGATDLYFFGYGRDYKRALAEFATVAGKVPAPPRYAFGLWYSRYWAYTDREALATIDEFERRGLPLDVFVLDMDWHETHDVDKIPWDVHERDQAGQPKGWTGYTWNRRLFPDPARFFAEARKRGVRTAMNLHPASGVQPHEEMYEEFARAVGMNPKSRKHVPFAVEDPKFAKPYFELLHRPREKEGVDFWWLDWQQRKTTSIDELNPTFALNHLHFRDNARGGKRPLILHRWGGLGNHRYQVGFSGDAKGTWESLAFQIRFTHTASNVLYGYWSHDVGGHYPAVVDPELMTRWTQFGALSPVFRLHSTKRFDAERRPFRFPEPWRSAMEKALEFRRSLLPYIYNAARAAHDTGVSLVRPAYYEHPHEPDAYRADDQYYFGDDLIVAPVVAPAKDPDATKRSVWLPDGVWYDWETLEEIEGGGKRTRRYTLDEMPVYARNGAIVPTVDPATPAEGAGYPDIAFTIFPGKSGETTLYEDDGVSDDYLKGASARTIVRQTSRARSTVIEIGATEGTYNRMPKRRRISLRLPLAPAPRSVVADGVEIPHRPLGDSPGWRYLGDRLTAEIDLGAANARDSRRIEISFAERLDEFRAAASGFPGERKRAERAATLLNTLWRRGGGMRNALVDQIQTGRRIELAPTTALDELRAFKKRKGAAARETNALAIREKTKEDERTLERARRLLR